MSIEIGEVETHRGMQAVHTTTFGGGREVGMCVQLTQVVEGTDIRVIQMTERQAIEQIRMLKSALGMDWE